MSSGIHLARTVAEGRTTTQGAFRYAGGLPYRRTVSIPGSKFFGRWVARRREDLGLTQRDLADRLGWGLETVRRIEQGRRGLRNNGEVSWLSEQLQSHPDAVRLAAEAESAREPEKEGRAREGHGFDEQTTPQELLDHMANELEQMRQENRRFAQAMQELADRVALGSEMLLVGEDGNPLLVLKVADLRRPTVDDETLPRLDHLRESLSQDPERVTEALAAFRVQKYGASWALLPALVVEDMQGNIDNARAAFARLPEEVRGMTLQNLRRALDQAEQDESFRTDPEAREEGGPVADLVAAQDRKAAEALAGAAEADAETEVEPPARGRRTRGRKAS